MHKIRFLTVELDPAALSVLQQVIVQMSYGTMKVVVGVREALEIVASEQVDFVICNWERLNGPEIGFVKVVKRQRKFRNIPIILTSRVQVGSGEADKIKRAAAAGVDGYLIKPYTNDQVIKAFDEVLVRYSHL